MKKKWKIIFLFLIFISFSFFIFFQIYFQKTQAIKEKKAKIEEILKEIGKMNPDLPDFRFGSFANFLESDFFKEIKEKLLRQELDFLLIDLSKKELDFFKGGKLEKSYLILALGKEGSFWETPVGFYQVEAKIKNAFSRIGQVYMPYSLQFQGNFFIHGWPYYPNGQPVSSTFSGGCIRLSTADAKEIFEKVEIGTPILIIESSFLRDDFSYQLKEPKISAQSYLVADLRNHFIFLEKNSKDPLPIASLTKLITALVATEYLNLWKKIEIKESDLIFTSKPRLKPGQFWTGFDLLYPLLNESSNEAAKALSRFLGEGRFIEMMNKKAKSLGLENAHFEDSFGGAKENIASAQDLFFLAKYLYHNRKFILDISRGKIYPHLISRSFQDLENFNCFWGKENFIGGKVGQSAEAGQPLLSIFEIEFKNQKRPIVIILLGSENNCAEGEKILEWLERTFE